MAIPQALPRARRRRHLALIVSSVVAALALAVLFLLPSGDDGLTAVSELEVGECFAYPGDGVEPTRVETVPCSQVHFAEVYGTTAAGDDDSCVGLFEQYTGAENYWETNYIIGFIDVDESLMHCYLYAAEDFAGSVAVSR